MMGCLGERNPNRVLNSQKDQTNGYETPQQENIHEYAKKLQKENLRLTRALAEKSKLLKLSCTENQKLRMNLRDLKKKNLQFAKANCQILAELKANRDRLKALEHELGCRGEKQIGDNAINKNLTLSRVSSRRDFTVFDFHEEESVGSISEAVEAQSQSSHEISGKRRATGNEAVIKDPSLCETT